MDNVFFISGYFYNLSSIEQKLLISLIDLIKPTENYIKECELDNKAIESLVKLLQLDSASQLFKTMKKLMKNIFEIKDGKRIFQASLFLSLDMIKGRRLNKIIIRFNPDLNPYILNLRERESRNITKLKSKYSLALYEILKCNNGQSRRRVRMDVRELREFLNAENIYSKHNDFKRYVLKRAQEEIKNSSDIKFSFREIKRGRKIKSIEFTVIKIKHVENHEIINVKSSIGSNINSNLKSNIDYITKPVKPDIKSSINTSSNYDSSFNSNFDFSSNDNSKSSENIKVQVSNKRRLKYLRKYDDVSDRFNRIDNSNKSNEFDEFKLKSKGGVSKGYSDFQKVVDIIKNKTGIDISLLDAKEIYENAISHRELKDTPLDLISKVAEYSKNQKIFNFSKWFKITVKNFKDPKGAVNSFNNFISQDYDFEELERKLIEATLKDYE